MDDCTTDSIHVLSWLGVLSRHQTPRLSARWLITIAHHVSYPIDKFGSRGSGERRRTVCTWRICNVIQHGRQVFDEELDQAHVRGTDMGHGKLASQKGVFEQDAQGNHSRTDDALARIQGGLCYVAEKTSRPDKESGNSKMLSWGFGICARADQSVCCGNGFMKGSIAYHEKRG